MSSIDLELPEIQGIVLFAYGDQRVARFCFLRIDDPAAARAWLGRVRGEVRCAGPEHKGRPSSFNLAFTAAGLRALGLPADPLETFPREFLQGMADEERALVLGDEGPSAPSTWEFGGPATPPVHVCAMLYARDMEALARLESSLELGGEAGSSGMSPVARIDSERLEGDREHFGFRDGIAQPPIAGVPIPRARAARAEHPVAPGEFVLGYDNEYSQLPLSPSVAAAAPGAALLPPLAHAPDTRRDLGRNGTYLVLRKIRQHVGDFWRCMHDHATTDFDAEAVATRVIGRWPDGTPLAPGAKRPLDDFDFAGDPQGLVCPRGAHVRRANPRGALEPGPEESRVAVRRHRILRRGRPYGAPLPDARRGVDDGADRGLVFVGLNTNIVRQFEFVQQTWMNNVKFARLHDEDDPLLGQRLRGRTSFTIPADPVRVRLTEMPRFVTVRGGGYFFVPSATALEYLAGLRD